MCACGASEHSVSDTEMEDSDSSEEYSEYSEDSEGQMETESDDWDSEDSEGGMMMMRLHIMRGSFFSACADLGGGCPIMDAKLWSKLPEDILWRVVRFVPAVKRFQFQSVSRKWWQVLTSADFRNTIALAPREPEEQRVIAYVAYYGDQRSRKKLRVLDVLDIDLSSFVPSWFRKPGSSYSVVAAANGLVCVSNDDKDDNRYRYQERSKTQPSTTRYCVVNPLTRTCIVLPKLPFWPRQWLPPTTTTLTICSSVGEAADWKVATFDLTTGGGWEVAVRRFTDPVPEPWTHLPAALCSGETYLYNHDNVQLLTRSPGPDGLVLEVAASLELPSVTLLGLDSASHSLDRTDAYLLAHRSTLFFIARMRHQHSSITYRGAAVACGIWRLAPDRMEWEAVARLDVSKLERLTGLGRGDYDCCMSSVFGVCGVREFVCCHHQVWESQGPAFHLLGFNLDTGDWDVLHNERGCKALDLFELRPDVFLPETISSSR